MDAEVRASTVGELTVQRVVQTYPLEPGLTLTLTPEATCWSVAVQGPVDPIAADPVYGADALAHLLRYDRVPPVDRFRLTRHMSTPEASGERPVDDDGQVVVVGERVVVTWTRSVSDRPYSAPVTLAQLAAVDFLGIPDTHGLLTWTTPRGHEAPIAVVTRYLPRALDGRQALVSLLERGFDREPAETPPLSTRMGRITAALHVALATRSTVLADPVRTAAAEDVLAWHVRAATTVERAALIAAEGTTGQLGAEYLSRLERYTADLAALPELAAQNVPIQVQRVHGDLHAGRLLRWAGGLAITGFGDEPPDEVGLGPQPAARELARLLHSLDGVARQVDENGAAGACTHDWLPGARDRLLTAYRMELAVARRPELLDDRLLAAFEAEHAAREVVSAARR